ncbi:hypothetical protein I302_102993 [Kwoniella bestiolae CBS 10118]|uniref:Uncharacterized protein n=1 Tax=Kwoniella bestiolae CBS 10118 TaxID=1296100 RepID=A0A1B9GGK3_9TREE|nr:hypothetical protein I302_01689 [Kwoniella bestiolae CBS 10118]OCF30170.1 hypothetical protein I302_01689 [Kwoniella bestiolae CBS 10118]
MNDRRDNSYGYGQNNWPTNHMGYNPYPDESQGYSADHHPPRESYTSPTQQQLYSEQGTYPDIFATSANAQYNPTGDYDTVQYPMNHPDLDVQRDQLPAFQFNAGRPLPVTEVTQWTYQNDSTVGHVAEPVGSNYSGFTQEYSGTHRNVGGYHMSNMSSSILPMSQSLGEGPHIDNSAISIASPAGDFVNVPPGQYDFLKSDPTIQRLLAAPAEHTFYQKPMCEAVEDADPDYLHPTPSWQSGGGVPSDHSSGWTSGDLGTNSQEEQDEEREASSEEGENGGMSREPWNVQPAEQLFNRWQAVTKEWQALRVEARRQSVNIRRTESNLPDPAENNPKSIWKATNAMRARKRRLSSRIAESQLSSGKSSMDDSKSSTSKSKPKPRAVREAEVTAENTELKTKLEGRKRHIKALREERGQGEQGDTLDKYWRRVGKVISKDPHVDTLQKRNQQLHRTIKEYDKEIQKLYDVPCSVGRIEELDVKSDGNQSTVEL